METFSISISDSLSQYTSTSTGKSFVSASVVTGGGIILSRALLEYMSVSMLET